MGKVVQKLISLVLLSADMVQLLDEVATDVFTNFLVEPDISSFGFVL